MIPAPPVEQSELPSVRRHRSTLLGSITFTVILLGAIALALHGTSPAIAVSTVLAVILLVGVFHFVFSGSDFFSLIFANSVGVYACLYVIFVLANFPQADALSVQTGFVLPLLAFAAGALAHRRQIQNVINRSSHHVTVPFREAARWIGPLIIVAAVTTYLQIAHWSTDRQDVALITSMAVIAVIAWLTSKYITIFLMECGLIFRSFLRNVARLARPAFALLTCYSLLTITFGCIYTIYDQSSSTLHFLTNGTPQKLAFPDGLYLSISTLTTVGFGDIAAGTPLARLIVSAEVLCGVLLLMFGVEAMLDRKNAS